MSLINKILNDQRIMKTTVWEIENRVLLNNHDAIHEWGAVKGHFYNEDTIAKLKECLVLLSKTESMTDLIGDLFCNDITEKEFDEKWQESIKDEKEIHFVEVLKRLKEELEDDEGTEEHVGCDKYIQSVAVCKNLIEKTLDKSFPVYYVKGVAVIGP